MEGGACFCLITFEPHLKPCLPGALTQQAPAAHHSSTANPALSVLQSEGCMAVRTSRFPCHQRKNAKTSYWSTCGGWWTLVSWAPAWPVPWTLFVLRWCHLCASYFASICSSPRVSPSLLLLSAVAHTGTISQKRAAMRTKKIELSRLTAFLWSVWVGIWMRRLYL